MGRIITTAIMTASAINMLVSKIVILVNIGRTVRTVVICIVTRIVPVRIASVVNDNLRSKKAFENDVSVAGVTLKAKETCHLNWYCGGPRMNQHSNSVNIGQGELVSYWV